MAEEKFSDGIPEVAVDLDASDIPYPQQQEVQLENLVNASEVPAVQPLVYGFPSIKGYTGQGNSVTVLGNALQDSSCDEQREVLEMKNCTEDSGIFTIKTTHFEQINVDEVIVFTNSESDGADRMMEEEISNGSDCMAIAEVPPAQGNKFDPAFTDVNAPPVVGIRTDMMNIEKPKLMEVTDVDDDAVHTDCSESDQYSDIEETTTTSHMLTRSAARAARLAKLASRSAKFEKKRKRSATSSTSGRSTRTSLAKKLAKKPRRSFTTYK